MASLRCAILEHEAFRPQKCLRFLLLRTIFFAGEAQLLEET